jgi:hypothetical protein
VPAHELGWASVLAVRGIQFIAKRKLWQIHLSTAIIVSVFAGVLMLVEFDYHEGIKAGIDSLLLRLTKADAVTTAGGGMIYLYAMLNIPILLVATLVVEWVTRRRERRQS